MADSNKLGRWGGRERSRRSTEQGTRDAWTVLLEVGLYWDACCDTYTLFIQYLEILKSIPDTNDPLPTLFLLLSLSPSLPHRSNVPLLSFLPKLNLNPY
jgi:hypothetical protein